MKSTSILKHNLMRAAMTLALIVTCATAWAQNPNLADYTFTTGQNANKWITLSGNAIQMIASGKDDDNSELTNIGFDFPFGDGTYSQFWTNSNGILSFNSEPSSNLTCQFTQGFIHANQPKICGISADMSTGNNGYVKYELTGTEPNRVLVCEFFLYGGGSNTGVAATIKWQVQLHEANAKVVMVYGDALDTNLRSNQIGLSQSGSDIWTINPSTHEAIHSTGAVGTTYRSWPGAYRYYQFNPPHPPFTDNGDGTYTINTAEGWDVFCDMLDGGETFSGKIVKLDANIEVSRMAGTYSATTNSGHAFSGAFNGYNNTLTFSCTAADNYVAPFAYLSGTSAAHASISDLNVVTNITAIDHRHIAGLVALHKGNVDVTNCHAVVNLNATVGNTNPSDLYPAGLVSQTDSSGRLTISNCTTTGTITTDGKYAAGLVGVVQGTDTIEDCVSSVTINSSTAGDGTHGGLVAVTQTNSTTTIEGCLFNGKLLTANTGETATGNCGGILGWKNATVTIKNTLYAPAELNDGEHEVVAGTGVHPSGTFYRGNTPTLTNCYYTRALGTPQGTQAYSITAGENVTVDYDGTPTNIYATSGIITYATGIKCNNVLYAGNEETISLTLGNTPPQGSIFMGYTVSPEGTILNGTSNPYTLTMPDENVTIGAMMKGPVTYLDENGVEQTKQPGEYTMLTNTMITLGSADTETWYVADGTLNFNHTINVNGVVHLILKDNAVMNVGTEQNPISDSGISAEGPSISIYGQSTGSDIGMLSVYATYCGIYDYDYNGNNNNPNYDYAVTINGGNIYLSCGEYGIQSNKVTINGGQVEATAGLYGIASNLNTTLGWNSPYDFIYANNYQDDVIVKEGKTFTDGYDNVFSGTVAPASISGKTLYPAVAVTLNDGITAGNGIITSGENHYAQVGQTITVDASNVTAPAGYAVSGITVTPSVTVTDNHDGTYSFTTPAADVTVNATFALQPVSVNYLDADGVQHTVDALPLLGGDATTLAAGWYVVNSDISYTGTVSLVGSGDVKLILADDHTMNVGTSENRIEYGIKTYNNDQTLTIYGQSTGNHMGILSIYTSHYCIYPLALTINGGHVIANADGNYATALRTTYQTITINGGIVEATATGNGAYAIHSGDNFTYAGGTLITNAASENAIKAYHGRYTFTWRNPNDSITIGSTGLYAPDNTYTATFTKAFTDGTNIYSGTLTGSQLNALAGRTLHPVTAYKTIAAHSTTEQPVSGWYLIASPVGNVSATAVNNLANTNDNDGFDLYRFNQAADAEWENWKSQECEGNHYHFDLESGRGYLYANAANVNLIFTGTPYNGNDEVTLTIIEGAELSGWNLVGNPFTVAAYIDKTDFYRMNEEGSEIEVATDNAIAPMEGIFVLADENGETLTFSAQEPNKGHSEKPKPEQIVLNLSRNGGSVIDRAIVRMGEGQTLPKFQIRENSTKLYIPQDGKDYAIVSVGNVSEIPVNFKAEENGTYTLTVSPTLNSQLSTLNYLHLIDNITGADIDLIPSLRAERSNPEPPVSYTFTAKTTDYESRFKLVFIANDASTGSTSDATFAFVSNGNLIVNGEGTLQVIDLMGRVIRTVGLSQCGSRTSTAGMTPCVYVLRLINGDNVRTQKIVIP